MFVGTHILFQLLQTHQVVLCPENIVRPIGATGVHPHTLGQYRPVHRQIRLRVVGADAHVAVVLEEKAVVHADMGCGPGNEKVQPVPLVVVVYVLDAPFSSGIERGCGVPE